MSLLKYILMSDTHGRVHNDVFAHLEGAKAILHAGDVGGDVHNELGNFAPVYAVCGNTDYSAPHLPNARVEHFAFGAVGIAHGHLQAQIWETRVLELYKMFEPNGVRLVLTGHSHQQYLQFRNGVWLINPGAVTRPRFHQQSGFCVMTYDEESDLLQFDFKALDWS